MNFMNDAIVPLLQSYRLDDVPSSSLCHAGKSDPGQGIQCRSWDDAGYVKVIGKLSVDKYGACLSRS